MVLVLQGVSSHLLGVAGIESALCAQVCLANRLLPHAPTDAFASAGLSDKNKQPVK